MPLCSVSKNNSPDLWRLLSWRFESFDYYFRGYLTALSGPRQRIEKVICPHPHTDADVTCEGEGSRRGHSLSKPKDSIAVLGTGPAREAEAWAAAQEPGDQSWYRLWNLASVGNGCSCHLKRKSVSTGGRAPCRHVALRPAWSNFVNCRPWKGECIFSQSFAISHPLCTPPWRHYFLKAWALCLVLYKHSFSFA